jgi:hypothetical protein
MHPRASWRVGSRIIVEEPANSTELDYRDILSDANECFFHREYTVALERYLELRQKITVQSHPELPFTKGLLDEIVLDAKVIDPRRIIELSRRLVSRIDPGDPVILPADDRRLFSLSEVRPNETLAKFADVAVDPGFSSRERSESMRLEARRLIADGRTREAERLYQQQAKLALSQGAVRLAADTLTEHAAVLATYVPDDDQSLTRRATQLFQQAGSIYRDLGDQAAQEAITSNLRLLDTARDARPAPGLDTPIRLPRPLGDRPFMVLDKGMVTTTARLVTKSAPVSDSVRSIGVLALGGSKVISLDPDRWTDAVVNSLLDVRRTATTLDELRIVDVVGPTFVAYLTQLYFYTLPLAIGDTYAALGRYQQAISYYTGVLSYPWLNAAIEGADLWQRIAKAQLAWGDELFRRQLPSAARPHYEQIIILPFAIPASPLYQPAAFATSRAQADEVAKSLLGQPAAAVNPKLAELVTAAARQLLKIDAGLNILGLSEDYAPVLRFTYLQSAANYLTDNAIQAERTFIQFRSQAEQQKFERIQLENAVALNEAALAVEQKRTEDAALEVEAAQRTQKLTELRQANAQANLDDWNTIGAELASVNAALAWASNAANDQDITYTNVRYHGESHDYSGDVEDFFDTVGEVREWLNFDIQQNRLERQVNEAAAEVSITKVRSQQAQVRLQVQRLNSQLARVRLDGSREVLDYAEDRMFDEDLWFRLAGDMQDLARGYLDMAIEAAYVMERAYAVEFERNLRRIRLDYGISGPSGLLGGDHLKQDIASFTLDYIQHAQKQNPIRVALSMREEFPQAFNVFQRTGTMEFRTDLEIFDRRYPGTWRRKIKRIEVFVEGLIPSTGISGSLQHAGMSTEWRQQAEGWFKHNRVVPVESMILSSYQFRRDYAVLTPKEEVLTIFENLGPQGNWKLTVWPSANDVDFESISDVTLVFYLDGDIDSGLEEHTRALYGTTGGRSFVRSARFHEPDEYFQIERKRTITFRIRAAQLPAWVTSPQLTALTFRLVTAPGAVSLGIRTLTITRGSDAASISGQTDANGVLASAVGTMAPFNDWINDPVADTYTVTFADGDDLTSILDVHLAVTYQFTYRPDPED